MKPKEDLSKPRPMFSPRAGVYNPIAVNKAIESSNRSGRRISGREAKLIHALLKGRH